MTPLRRTAQAVAGALMLAACASTPDPGTRISVHVERPAQAFELALPRHRAALAALQGRSPGTARESVWIVRCALGTDHGWTGLAVAPANTAPEAGAVWWLTVDDSGDDTRLGSGRLLAARTPSLPGRARAYDATLKRHPPPAAAMYDTVFGEYWIRCRAAASGA